MNEESQFARNRRSQVSSFIIHPSYFQLVSTVPPNFTPRLVPTSRDNAANRPSALSNARSLAASTFTTLAEIKPAFVTKRTCVG